MCNNFCKVGQRLTTISTQQGSTSHRIPTVAYFWVPILLLWLDRGWIDLLICPWWLQLIRAHIHYDNSNWFDHHTSYSLSTNYPASLLFKTKITIFRWVTTKICQWLNVGINHAQKIPTRNNINEEEKDCHNKESHQASSLFANKELKYSCNSKTCARAYLSRKVVIVHR